jgi:hypothetical protein
MNKPIPSSPTGHLHVNKDGQLLMNFSTEHLKAIEQLVSVLTKENEALIKQNKLQAQLINTLRLNNF